MFKPCILIPIYNNRDTIASVLERVRPYNLPCLVVNDGSNQETHDHLEDLAQQPLVQVKHLPQNGGKGQAIKAGILWAEELGFTNAVQVDADGQHRLEDIPTFLEAARCKPDGLVLGTPTFGEDVPKARLHGRKLSVYFVYLETLSRAIRDPLFGFRVYPVATTAEVIRRYYLGNRMEFDPEIAVKLAWKRLPITNIETPVIYPEGGTSHFRMIEDNIRITILHTRLTIGMLLRAPFLLLRRPP